MPAPNEKPKAHYKIPQIGPRFPTAAFLALLCIGFVCLYAALTMQPNYMAMKGYRDDPAYALTSGLFLKVQTLSNAIAKGNPKTVSEISALAHKLVLTPGSAQRPSQRRKLP
jgi:hypothetical protein